VDKVTVGPGLATSNVHQSGSMLYTSGTRIFCILVLVFPGDKALYVNGCLMWSVVRALALFPRFMVPCDGFIAASNGGHKR